MSIRRVVEQITNVKTEKVWFISEDGEKFELESHAKSHNFIKNFWKDKKRIEIYNPPFWHIFGTWVEIKTKQEWNDIVEAYSVRWPKPVNCVYDQFNIPGWWFLHLWDTCEGPSTGGELITSMEVSKRFYTLKNGLKLPSM